MTTTIKHTFPLEVMLDIEEDGSISRIHTLREFGEMVRAQITPEMTAEFARRAQHATRCRLDEGLVRMVCSHIAGSSTRYQTIERVLKRHFVINGVKYSRDRGWRAGERYSSTFVHKDDLAALNFVHKVAAPNKKHNP